MEAREDQDLRILLSHLSVSRIEISKPLEWCRCSKVHREEIYLILRSVIRIAALSCPSTTPVKDPMQRKLVLSAFGSPNHSNSFDFESSEWVFSFFFR